MHWKDLKELILRYNKRFFFKQQGITNRRIAEIEGQFGISLPQGYKDFLLDLGLESSLNAFATGYGSTSNIESLVACAKHYPTSEMFRIAMHDDKFTDSAPDIFIDLNSPKEYDATLLAYEVYWTFDRNYVSVVPLSLMELLTRQTCRHIIPFEKSFLLRKRLAEVVEALAKVHWNHALTPQKRIALMQLNDDFVLAEDLEQEGGVMNVCIQTKGDCQRILDALDSNNSDSIQL